jgi:hypothetical protein
LAGLSICLQPHQYVTFPRYSSMTSSCLRGNLFILLALRNGLHPLLRNPTMGWYVTIFKVIYVISKKISSRTVFDVIKIGNRNEEIEKNFEADKTHALCNFLRQDYYYYYHQTFNGKFCTILSNTFPYLRVYFNEIFPTRTVQQFVNCM